MAQWFETAEGKSLTDDSRGVHYRIRGADFPHHFENILSEALMIKFPTNHESFAKLSTFLHFLPSGKVPLRGFEIPALYMYTW